uniref:Ig-like domain-containing protein n=1 Tax=Aquila chrysaetos chrysaetos TaxID=223781 RepID=A0A663DPR1_AQUCH
SWPGAAAAQPWHVNGTVKEIEWNFSVGAGATIQVEEFGPSAFKRPDPKDRFKDRLEMFNKTALKIGALEWDNSGVYGAWIKLHPAVVENQSFNLSVYRPVPVPGIQHRLLPLTTQGFNVTLRCWVPASSNAEAIWQLSSSPRTPWGQLCEDSQTLCLAVPASTFSSSYTCVAQNPIQEKNTSIRLDALCQQAGTPDWWRWHMCLGLLAVGVGALLSVDWLRRKKRRKKAAEGGGCCWVKAMSSQPGLLGKQSWERGNRLFSFAVALPACPCLDQDGSITSFPASQLPSAHSHLLLSPQPPSPPPRARMLCRSHFMPRSKGEPPPQRRMSG